MDVYSNIKNIIRFNKAAFTLFIIMVSGVYEGTKETSRKSVTQHLTGVILSDRMKLLLIYLKLHRLCIRFVKTVLQIALILCAEIEKNI